MINLTEQLSSFDFYYKAIDEKSLGEYVAKHKEDASDEILPFINTENLALNTMTTLKVHLQTKAIQLKGKL